MRSWTLLPAIAVCFFCLPAITSGCAPSQRPNLHVAHYATRSSSTLNEMMNDDELFENVPFDTNKQTACSPTDQVSTGLG